MPRPDFQYQYQQIAREIKEQIARGELKPGMRLSSERILGNQFQVQRNTIRQALALLEDEGRISTEKRRGSFILPLPKNEVGGTFIVNMHRGSGSNLTALLDGFAHMAEERGFKAVRRNTNPVGTSIINVIPDIDELPADTAGVVLWPHYPSDPDRLRRLNDAVPLVLVDRHVIGVSADCVRFDDIHGGKLITEHLLSLGHRRIAFLTDEVFAETVQFRWHGYVLAQEEAGVEFDAKLSLLYQHMDSQIFANTFRYLMASDKTRPTAVVCANDLVAFSFLRFLHAEGIKTPEDVAVTGYGNSMPDYAEAMTLTTIDQPFREVGEEAAKLLAVRVHQPAAERLRRPEDKILPVRLVVRGSTVAPMPPERH